LEIHGRARCDNRRREDCLEAVKIKRKIFPKIIFFNKEGRKMMTSKAVLLTIGCCLFLACAKSDRFPSGQWVDLSHDFSDKTLYWTPTDNFKKETVAEGRTEKGYYYSAYKFSAPEHGGTHLDAPVHFAEGRKTADEISLTQLIAPAVKIDVSAKAANRDYLIGVEDFTAWEAMHGKIPDSSIVLLQTGYGQFWGDRAKYMGIDAGAADQKHFPGLSAEAARWLVQNRKINAVGIDTASIDFGQSQTFDAHVILMEQNIPAFENVANLDKVPPVGAMVFALPMKIKDGSGAPLRIAALIPDAPR
jgi:kynurenine formamidase